MKRVALITGAAGQDGSYLCELLLEKDYKIYALVPPFGTTENIDHLKDDVIVVSGDITNRESTDIKLRTVKPDEVYNLASQSHVGLSFKEPYQTFLSTAMGVHHIMESIRLSLPNTKFYQASTSEMFGNSVEKLQHENTPYNPVSPYGCAKLYAHTLAKNYRESYNMFICCGILFGHESPRRGKDFVTRKIARSAALIKLGKLDKLGLGNTASSRDWGHAKDYVHAMWMMMQHDTPDDYVIATGRTHSVQEFVDVAFDEVGLDPGKYIYTDPQFYRPIDVDVFVGDSTKARNVLGWKETFTFDELVRDMVRTELERLEE